ncbi:hypothetical protein IAR50_007167 [Cryptococcus sp. DSM 104548]
MVRTVSSRRALRESAATATGISTPQNPQPTPTTSSATQKATLKSTPKAAPRATPQKATPAKRTPAKRGAAAKREPSPDPDPSPETAEVSNADGDAEAEMEPEESAEELVSIHNATAAKKRTRGGRVIKRTAGRNGDDVGEGESSDSDELGEKNPRKRPARKRANTERRSVQNKTAQKKYRDKKKSLARRTHDFALDMTRLCGKLAGKEGKVFKRLLEDYLADVSAIDRNFFDEYLEKAGLTQES